MTTITTAGVRLKQTLEVAGLTAVVVQVVVIDGLWLERPLPAAVNSRFRL